MAMRSLLKGENVLHRNDSFLRGNKIFLRKLPPMKMYLLLLNRCYLRQLTQCDGSAFGMPPKFPIKR